MIKPVGALCNLDCTYCYYLPTKTLYGGHEKRMSLRTLEEVFAGILPQFASDVTIVWQGGEPTLAGLPFFEQAIGFQARYAKPGQRIHHALQTNGTLLDDAWCKFLHDHDFLIGLSVDGPPRFHDHYRLTNRQGASSALVRRGHRLLQKHAVEYNILCVVNDFNVNHPDEVLGYLLNLGSRWVQFIPAIEWEKDPQDPTRNRLAPYSPRPEAYGRFLCRVFDLWFDKYRTRLSIRDFDAVLNKLVLGVMPLCILDGSCHNQLTIEHDGAVFGCDHFIERRWQLARIGEPGWANQVNVGGGQAVGLTVHGTGYQANAEHEGRDIDTVLAPKYVPESDHGPEPAHDGQALDAGWLDRVDGQRLGAFAARKQHLPEGCLSCQWKPLCYGGCPKHRPLGGELAELTILCEAYKTFYAHAMPRFEWLAEYLRKDQLPPDPIPQLQGRARAAAPALRSAGALAGCPSGGGNGGPVVWGASVGAVRRNDPCPCGSGLKFKRCHGMNR